MRDQTLDFAPLFEKRGNTVDCSVTDPPFDIELKQGPNRIAFLILAGMNGWKLVTSGPDELHAGFKAHAQRGEGETLYRLSFERPMSDRFITINLRVLDRDDDLFKQTLTLRDDWEGPTGQWLQIPAR